MIPRTLRPSLELLREEYVLIQAWKKTVAYIRRHNWFGDTLDLDLTAVDLKSFLDGIADDLKPFLDRTGSDLKDPPKWRNQPLRLVLAPKRQDWWVPGKSENSGTSTDTSRDDRWQPRATGGSQDVTNRLRPLAHVALRDQVLATALMLCLANRLENRQGDPRPRPRESEGLSDATDRFMSYGNRLLCDREAGELRHRWGSTKLYRSFYQDYRTFLKQPWKQAEAAVREEDGRRAVIVQTDIKRFYDQVTPEALKDALEDLRRPGDSVAFFELAKQVLCWKWDERDRGEVERYAQLNKTRELDDVVLPQGLVSAGFWANAILLRFDEALKEAQLPSDSGFRIVHACRYVDDIRVVLRTTDDRFHRATENAIEEKAKALVTNRGQELLDKYAHGLRLNCDKTEATEVGANQPGRILQSQRMNRIQTRVSGGFSASEGMELLEAIQGLLMLRSGFTRESDKSQWAHTPKPDVPEDTRARFGVFRYRKLVREVRPMLPDEAAGAARVERARPGTSVVTRKELDEMTRSFALVLIEKWVNDPSNVRILLTILDLWPEPKILKDVLDLLRPWTETDMGLPDAQRVAWYCLSEIFRAGATETGLFGDPEARPEDLNLDEYRRLLIGEAWRVVRRPNPALPWYLRQQALLLLFTSRSFSPRLHEACRETDAKHYRRMADVLATQAGRVAPAEFATYAVVLHRCFQKRIPGGRWTRSRMKALATRDPAFAAELLRERDGPLDNGWNELAKQLLVEPPELPLNSLARLVTENHIERDEVTLLRLALILLDLLKKDRPEGPVPPWRVELRRHEKTRECDEGKDFPWGSAHILACEDGAADDGELWRPPRFRPAKRRNRDAGASASVSEHWKHQLGYLLRFALARSPDVTANVSRGDRPPHSGYRSAASSWLQRTYGGYNSQAAFGGDWLPISDWFERFLSALLWWPGRRTDRHTEQIDKGIEATEAWIRKRTKRLEDGAGKATGIPFLPLAYSSQYLPTGLTRLTGCVVQTLFPTESDFDGDLTLSSPPNRARHRNHLTNTLALVRQGLRARQGAPGRAGGGSPLLDLLILPELSVHPSDIRRYLVPFSQAFKTVILAGVIYEELPPETTELVNTAVWVIPEYSEANGWNVRVRRQGKRHLAEPEQGRQHQGQPLTAYRPCQWIIECPSPRPEAEGVERLRLSAAVCYDATDLALASDLREPSDVFLVPALNKDVQTFDNLAIALSYQMHQLVVVANNGRYGGSSAYWPIGAPHERRLMHLHGQSQPTLGFFEISDVLEYRRGRVENLPKRYAWKAPPAGYPKKKNT